MRCLAGEIAAMALGDREDGRIKWQSDGLVRVLIGRLLPQGSAERQTPAGRSDFGMRWQNASARHRHDLPNPGACLSIYMRPSAAPNVVPSRSAGQSRPNPGGPFGG